MDTATLVQTLYLAATTLGLEVAKIAGDEVVREVTKEAFKQLKERVCAIFGSRAKRALAKLEEDPSSVDAQHQVEQAIGELAAEDRDELSSLMENLLTALKCDPAASRAQELRQLRLDLDANGHVVIERISGADQIDVRAKAKKNIEFRDVHLGTGAAPGK